MKDKPIPFLIDDDSDISFRRYPVDTARPESAEPLVRAQDFNLAGESFYARTDGFNAPYYEPLEASLPDIWIRRGIAEKLLRVDAALERHGVELFLLDGYRHYQCQRAIYRWFQRVAREAMPGATPEQIEEHISPYISNPGELDLNNPLTWFSHSTGAAIDLTLREIRTKQFLFMGGIFDDPSELSHTDYFERPGAPTGASATEARRNRRLLYWAMINEGFASLPSEWWHYDYGDQLWAKNRRIVNPSLPREGAFYGAMPAPVN